MLVVMVAVRMRRSLVSAFKELPRPAKNKSQMKRGTGEGGFGDANRVSQS